MKHALIALAVFAAASVTAAQDIRFYDSGDLVFTKTSDGRLIWAEDTAPAQQMTVTVSPAQVAVLRARWPNPQQIGLPEGTPATDQQLVQAFIDFGLSPDVERFKEARRQRRLQALTAAECQSVANTLKLAVTDLPCGGGQ